MHSSLPTLVSEQKGHVPSIAWESWKLLLWDIESTGRVQTRRSVLQGKLVVESIFSVKLEVGFFSFLDLPCIQEPFVVCFVCLEVPVAIFIDQVVLISVFPGIFT